MVRRLQTKLIEAVSTLPNKSPLFQTILIGMLASIIFGAIDALNFLLIEGPMEKFWEYTKLLDEKTIPLVNGGTAAAISIFIATYFEELLKKKYDMFNHPIIDAAGIIIGTIIIIFAYKLFLKLQEIAKKRKAARILQKQKSATQLPKH